MLSETRAKARSYYLFLTVHGLDHWGRYLDEFAPVDGTWLITHRREITDAAYCGWVGRACLGGRATSSTSPARCPSEPGRVPRGAGSLPIMAAAVDPTVDLPADVEALLDTPGAELMAQAAARRDAAHGARITFSPKVFIPLTMLCRDTCGYCTFAKPPAHVMSPYLELDDVLAIARRGTALGCHEALFTLGEAPEARYPDAAAWLAEAGTAPPSTTWSRPPPRSWPRPACSPTPTPVRSPRTELVRLRAVSPSQGMMIETLAARLAEPGGPHAGAPDKTPERRLATLEAAGQRPGAVHHRDPGRHRRDPARAARRPRRHRRRPRPPRARAGGDRPELPAQTRHLDVAGAACDPDEFLWTIAAARMVLDPSIHLQAPPNLSEPDALAALVDAGIDDWGGVSPVTPDHVNPERPWPDLEVLREATEAAGKTLAPRLTVYSEYVRDGDHWLHDDVRFAVRSASDLEGLPPRRHVGPRGVTPRRPHC